MTNYLLHPEIAGGLGEGTIIDRSVHPPVINVLDYEFEEWGGDDLIETFPAFIVTERLRDALQASSLTGFSFGSVNVSTTLNFDEFSTEPLPTFYRLCVRGHEGEDDLWLGEVARLMVNGRALDFLRRFTIENALIEEIS